MMTYAREFKLSYKDVLKNYKSTVRTGLTKYSLPGIKEKVKWTVYKLSPSGLFTHFSLLFMYGERGFTFELMCVGEPSGYYVTPHTAFKQRGSGTQLGVIRGSAGAIITKGLQCLANFGDYHIVTNNCQNFCSKLAGELGLPQPWTDVEMAATLILSCAVLVGGAILHKALFSSPSGDQQREQERRRR